MRTMNIILKSFDGPGDHHTIERAFQGKHLGTCISLLWDVREVPKIDADEHILLDARKLKNGKYPDTDWSTIPPLDEELIESMRHCEGVFMTMITRHSVDDIPFAERKRQYYEHLRYWNHIIASKKIDFFLLNHPPHQCYDLVIYDLCRLKSIPTLMIDRCNFIETTLLIETWEESGSALRDWMEKNRAQFGNLATPIPLSKKMESFYEARTIRDETPWYMSPRPSYLLQKNFVRKWAGRAMSMMVRKPKNLLTAVLSPRFWTRKLREHATINVYDELMKPADLSLPYVYVPFHMQPEVTTCPLGGVFVDQELMVQMLASFLPPGIRLYVKEHPHQGEQMRSRQFYESLVRISSVTLVPRDLSTVDLEKHAVAVATVTGTAGLEALFHCIPVLMFGHCYYQYASGVYRIRTSEECKRALDDIIVKKTRPELRDMRLFLKAAEECGVVFQPPLASGEQYSEPQATELGTEIAKKIGQMDAMASSR
ncbi:hypothetical protein EXS70_00015 [Candidatus Peribacteria bacterium]|nr:hypothetical protein [Candidatus Peribacteria bacterium]